MKTISDQYMAGLFDGEGCVSVILRRSKGHEYHQLDVRIAMTSEAVLQAVQRTFGGNISAREKRLSHHKQSWQWYCQGQVALEVLRRIRPFLIEKRAQADLAMRFEIAKERGLSFDHDRVRRQLQWLKQDTSRQLKVA
jgi:hypothetical protein